MNTSEKLAAYIGTWDLVPTGPPLTTHTSTLLPAVRGGEPVMLKLTDEPDERRGAAVLAWWGGKGAVRVLEIDEHAILMERAEGPRSLYDWSVAGQDDATIAVLCAVVAELHLPRQLPLPDAVSLEEWFAPLLAFDPSDSFVREGRRLAAELLANQWESVILHGDIHHRNVLDSGAERWVAIDPKGLLGDRAFDYVNIFRNPSFEIAGDPDRFRARLRQITGCADLEPDRMLRWIVAFCALSVVWDYYPEGNSQHDRAVGALAVQMLSERG